MRRTLVLGVMIIAIATGASAEGGKLLQRIFGFGGGNGASAATAVPAGVETHTIRVGNLNRTYYVYAPPGVPANAPLVLGLHGGNQDVMRFATGVGLFPMADRYGFVLALPVGVKKSWNAHAIEPAGYAMTNNIDDIGFIRAMVGEISASGRVNPNRVYAMGVSEGGMMVYDAACNLPGMFDALGVVASVNASGRCASPSGVSLLHIHGTDDQHIPLNGGAGTETRKGVAWPSVLDGIRNFAAGASCSPNWSESRLTSDTICETTSCPGSDVVEYCLVQGGGHTWPGVQETDRQARQGASSTMTFSATDMIAQFFLAH